MPIHHEISTTLQQAAENRHRATQARKTAQSRTLGARGYHKLQKQLNKEKFLAPINSRSTQANIYYIKKRFMRFCYEKQHGDWNKAIHRRYCDKGLIMTFLRWICEAYLQPRRKRSKRKTVNQYWRDFKMLYRRTNKGRVVNANDCEEIRKYINGTLKDDFDLDIQAKCKPVMGVDDLLLGLTHHWSRDTSIFPTEDDRLDLPTIMLFQSYTGCRPAELVDGTKSRGDTDPLLDDPDNQYADAVLLDINTSTDSKTSNRASRAKNSHPMVECKPKDEFNSDSESGLDFESDSESGFDEALFDEADRYDSDTASGTCSSSDDDVEGEISADKSNTFEDGEKPRKHKALCYEDTVLWIVKDPKNPGRDALAMEVHFRHHKGADNKPKPTIFLFRENPLPILCPISHILARAIRDDAIQVNGFTTARPFFFTNIRKTATKVHWKPSKLKTPIFRRSVRTAAGWVKSDTDPMKYSAYAFYLDRIGAGLGSEEKWTSYCMRRGNCNAILGVAPDGVVDQVMRHDPMTGVMQNSYLNSRVGFNTQDAFLERDPSADGLTKAFTHMSIRCDPEVPKEIPRAELDKLPPDPEIIDLSKRVKQLRVQIKYEYRFIKAAPAQVQKEYRQLQKNLKNAEKAFRDDMTREYQEACRRRIHNEELERQLSGTVVEEKTEPIVQHHLEERTQLSSIMCDFRSDLSGRDITDRKVSAIDLLVRLAARREVRPPRSLRTKDTDTRENSPTEEKSSPKVEDIPLVLGRTQCIYCVGNEQLPHADRMRPFKRVSHMMDHVENVHLRHEPATTKFVCRHPQCKHLGDFLTSLDHFKVHVQKIHGVKLRPRPYLPEVL